MLLLTPNPPTTDQPGPVHDVPWDRRTAATIPPAMSEDVPPPTGSARGILRAPGLVVVAALCILQGYLWTGVIPSASSHRALAAVILLASIAALTLSRPRTPVRRTALELSALVGPAVLASVSLLHPLLAGSSLRTAVGIGDLLAATVLVGVVGIGEWRRRPARVERPAAGSDDLLRAPSIPVA